MRKSLLVLVFLILLPVYGQGNNEIPVISSENYLHLQSQIMINFADGFRSVGEIYSDIRQYPQIETGWFAINNSADVIALSEYDNVFLLNLVDNEALILGIPKYLEREFADYARRLVDVVLDGYFPYGVYLTDAHFRIFYGGTNIYGNAGEEIQYLSNETPQSIWLDCSNHQDGCYPWLEVIDNNNETSIIRMPTIRTLENDFSFTNFYVVRPNVIEFNDSVRISYAPSQDPEAVVRIGRIPPPYVVTSSMDGIVKLWNIQTGETLYEVDNGTGQPSVFGAINIPPSHLVWRDNENQSLYLLNFETGENRLIDELNGDYAQWYFLSNDASVILAVNLGFEPNVFAWDTATGERTDLGAYRQCERPQPDMARLSEDGTTLVIGCDTGLDIWRVTPSP